MVRVLSGVLGQGIAFLAQFITAARGIWAGSAPEPEQRVYFANHTSNGDFVLIWSVLPAHLRRQVRPVAAADYWLAGPIRRYVVEAVFRAVLIEQNPEQRSEDPVAQMIEALDAGASLILFPEGRRNPEGLGPFRTGLFHLAEARPTVALVPV
ncbi:MAG: lysophospholipid acyltransferase family protein, partial [Pseudomonadota bacterium]